MEKRTLVLKYILGRGTRRQKITQHIQGKQWEWGMEWNGEAEQKEVGLES